MRSRRLTWSYLATAVLVAVLTLVWSEISHQPDCAERPCARDAPLMLGAGMEAMLLLAYLGGMLALWLSERRRRTEHERPAR